MKKTVNLALIGIAAAFISNAYAANCPLPEDILKIETPYKKAVYIAVPDAQLSNTWSAHLEDMDPPDLKFYSVKYEPDPYHEGEGTITSCTYKLPGVERGPTVILRITNSEVYTPAGRGWKPFKGKPGALWCQASPETCKFKFVENKGENEKG